MDGEGLLNEELPNCWECPKCYQEDSSEKAQVREHFQSCTVRGKQVSSLEITFAFACFFWPRRLFFVSFVIFFPLCLAIFLLSCEFSFFALLSIVPRDSANSQCSFTPRGPWKRGATAELFEEGNEVIVVCEEWNLRGGSNLSQLVHGRVLEFPVVPVHIFVCFTFVAKSPTLVPSCVLQRQSLFRRKPVLWPWPQATMVAGQWPPVMSEGQKDWSLRPGRHDLLRACTEAAIGLRPVITPWQSPPGTLYRTVGTRFLVSFFFFLFLPTQALRSLNFSI